MAKRNLLIVVSGPSGTGKGTICKALVDKNPDGIKLSVSATSRDQRPGETEGKSYYFIGRDRFEDGIRHKDFLEYAEVYGNYYGTLKSEIDRLFQKNCDVILEIDMQGAMQVKEQTKDAVFVFIMPPSFEELRQRILARKRDSAEDIQNRLSKISSELQYIAEYDYIVVNDRLDDAVRKMEAIILAEKCRFDEKIFDIKRFL